MKFTIFNYSSDNFLQPIYFYSAIKKIEGCDAVLVNGTQNVYHVYDSFRPDYAIVNSGMDLSPLLHYNMYSGNTIKHILNLDYLKDEHIDDAKSFLKHEKEFNCVLAFSTNFKHSKIDFGIPYVHISNCADNNIPKEKQLFSIEKAVIVSRSKDIKDYAGSTYHIIQVGGGDTVEGVDFKVNSVLSSKLFANYNEVIIRNVIPHSIPEVFFNAAYLGKRIYFDNDTNSEEVDKVLKKILGLEHSFDYHKKINYDTNELRGLICKKFLPKNKLKQLLSHIPNTQKIIQSL